MHHTPIPMLARVYAGDATSIDFSQPKLDGVRAIATREGLWTRSGIRITTCLHVENALARYFAKHPTTTLDGELYTHEFKDDLGKIISVVNARRETLRPTPAAAERLEFHVFDVIDAHKPFADRWSWFLNKWAPRLTRPVRFVATTEVHSIQEMDALFAQYLAEGYEGQMLRRNVPYEPGRSSALLKRKPFIDEEFPVVAIEPVRGQTTAYAKRVTLALPDGRTFKAGISGSHEYAAKLLHQTFSLATIRYSSRSRNGIPRSPVAVAFHSSMGRSC